MATGFASVPPPGTACVDERLRVTIVRPTRTQPASSGRPDGGFVGFFDFFTGGESGALKKHVKEPDQARKIMNYIMETYNEINKYADQAVRVSMCMHSRSACHLIRVPSLSAHPSIFRLRLCSV